MPIRERNKQGQTMSAAFKKQTFWMLILLHVRTVLFVGSLFFCEGEKQTENEKKTHVQAARADIQEQLGRESKRSGKYAHQPIQPALFINDGSERSPNMAPFFTSFALLSLSSPCRTRKSQTLILRAGSPSP